MDTMDVYEDVMRERAKRREHGGRVVRDAWIAWARTQEHPKPSWLVPYDDLSDAEKEADRLIYEAVWRDLGWTELGIIY